jgi:hypothetical protein
MPDEMQSLSELYFFTMKIYTSAKQVRILSVFFTVEFACGTPREDKAPSLGLYCRCGSQ